MSNKAQHLDYNNKTEKDRMCFLKLRVESHEPNRFYCLPTLTSLREVHFVLIMPNISPPRHSLIGTNWVWRNFIAKFTCLVTTSILHVCLKSSKCSCILNISNLCLPLAGSLPQFDVKLLLTEKKSAI